MKNGTFVECEQQHCYCIFIGRREYNIFTPKAFSNRGFFLIRPFYNKNTSIHKKSINSVCVKFYSELNDVYIISNFFWNH